MGPPDGGDRRRPDHPRRRRRPRQLGQRRSAEAARLAGWPQRR